MSRAGSAQISVTIKTSIRNSRSGNCWDMANSVTPMLESINSMGIVSLLRDSRRTRYVSIYDSLLRFRFFNIYVFCFMDMLPFRSLCLVK